MTWLEDQIERQRQEQIRAIKPVKVSASKRARAHRRRKPRKKGRIKFKNVNGILFAYTPQDGMWHPIGGSRLLQAYPKIMKQFKR